MKNIIELIDIKDKKISELSSNNLNNQLEDLKKQQLTKDLEISKLNAQIIFKIKEIEKLKKELDDKTPIDIKKKEEELENKYKDEFDKLKKKSNDLEIKIYNSNDKISKLEKDNNLKESKIKELEKEIENLKLGNQTFENEKKERINNEENNEFISKEKYNNLNEEFNKLKLELSNLYPKNMEEINNLKENYNKEIIELNKKIELIKKENLEQFKMKEKAFLKVNEENSKIINDKEIIILELKEEIKKNIENMKINKKSKIELENLIIKQEDKVKELEFKVKKIETILKNKNIELQQNENYAIQLINIINEQKIKFDNIKNQNKEKENEKIKYLKHEIENLRSLITIKETTIEKIKKNHKLLQDKYLKLCIEKRKKENEDLLIQVKEMKIKKNERVKSLNKNYISRSTEKIFNKNEKKSVLNIKNKINKNYPTLNSTDNYTSLNSNNISNIFPVIGNSNENKNFEENYDLSYLKLEISNDDQISKINNMMKKIIDEF